MCFLMHIGQVLKSVSFYLISVSSTYGVSPLAIATLYDIEHRIDGLAQACNNSIANALQLLQSCAKPSVS